MNKLNYISIYAAILLICISFNRDTGNTTDQKQQIHSKLPAVTSSQPLKSVSDVSLKSHIRTSEVKSASATDANGTIATSNSHKSTEIFYDTSYCHDVYMPGGKYDPEKYKHLYPYKVTPLYFSIVYLNSELTEFLQLYRSDISKIEVIGRRQRGYPVFTYSGELIQLQGFIEVYKVRVSLSGSYLQKKPGINNIVEGYMLADDVLKKDKKLSSGRLQVWESKSVGCVYYEPSGDYIDRSVYFFESMGSMIYLGYHATFSWAPNNDYFLVSAFNRFENYRTAIYNYLGGIVWKSAHSYNVHSWLQDNKIVYLKSNTDAGEPEIYLRINLATGDVKRIAESEITKK